MRDLPSVAPGSHGSSPDRSKARIWRPTAMALAGVLLGAWTQVASAQQASVAGQVTDSVSRHPLVSAQVLVGGTTLRTLTDRAGRFRFDAVPAGGGQLRVLPIGCKASSRTLRVAGGERADAGLPLPA